MPARISAASAWLTCRACSPPPGLLSPCSRVLSPNETAFSPLPDELSHTSTSVPVCPQKVLASKNRDLVPRASACVFAARASRSRKTPQPHRRRLHACNASPSASQDRACRRPPRFLPARNGLDELRDPDHACLGPLPLPIGATGRQSKIWHRRRRPRTRRRLNRAGVPRTPLSASRAWRRSWPLACAKFNFKVH